MKRSFRRALEFWTNFLDLDFFFLFMETNDVLTGSMSWKFYFSCLIEVFKVLFELIPLIFFNLKR